MMSNTTSQHNWDVIPIGLMAQTIRDMNSFNISFWILINVYGNFYLFIFYLNIQYKYDEQYQYLTTIILELVLFIYLLRCWT